MTKSENPLLSICIPTYNRPDLLNRTLKSFEDGTKDVEVIIGDNSDNDKSLAVVKDTLKTFKGKWQYQRNIPSLGPVENMNDAIKKATGNFIYVFHDDDYLFPGGLHTILEYLNKYHDQQVLTFGVKLVDLTEKVLKTEAPKIEKYLSPAKATFNILNNSSFIRMPSIIINANAYKEVGYWDPKMAPPEDIDMFVRLAIKYGLYRIPKIVAAYTIHEGAWTTKVFNEDTISILLKIFSNVEKKKVLDNVTFKKAKSCFFHQFILAGAYRSIKRKDFIKANRIMQLFKMKELNDLKIIPKWVALKLTFLLIVKISLLVKI